MDKDINIGYRIKELRKSKGLTQEQLAEKVGIDDKHLSKIENNKHQPTYATLCKIAEILDLPIIDNKNFIEENPLYLKAIRILNSAQNDEERMNYLEALKLVQKIIKNK